MRGFYPSIAEDKDISYNLEFGDDRVNWFSADALPLGHNLPYPAV